MALRHLAHGLGWARLTAVERDHLCRRRHASRYLSRPFPVASNRVVPLPFLPLPCCIQAQSNIRLSARRAGGPTV